MVKQYPHRLVITTKSGSTQDGNGNWVPGTDTIIEKGCRAEPNGRNATVKAADGTAIVFDYTVYLPLPIDTIVVGSKVDVYSGGELLATNTVKRFTRGQLNARLWL